MDLNAGKLIETVDVRFLRAMTGYCLIDKILHEDIKKELQEEWKISKLQNFF
jgi:hypothetical protein